MRNFRFALIPAVLFLLPGVGNASWFPQQSGTTTNLHKVFFVNSQTGWAAGDSSLVLRTTNGGVQWVRSVYDTVLGSSEALWFCDSSLGWVADSNGMYKTADGGVHWQFLQNLTGVYFRDIVFVTPQRGWVTKNDFSYPAIYYFGKLYYSSDGGNTWVLRDSSGYGSWGYWKVSFADSMFGMLAEGNPGSVSPPVRISSRGDTKRTTDGGETWQTLPFAPDSGAADGVPMYTNVKVLNRNYAWRASFTVGWYLGIDFESGGISNTTVGGDTWTRMLNGASSVGGYPDYLTFAIVDTLKGYILYSDNLMGTLDGGATWVTLSLPGVKHDICFTDSLNGWIVGDQGLILHTSDGGLGVKSEPSPSRHPSYASRLTAYPNPFVSFARIPGHEAEHFALYDITGRMVGTFKGNRIGEGLQLVSIS
jgi:photosystem II stability/assembly factor-like uncharacterized protein